MKNIFGFIRWQWNKFEFWQKCWILSMLFFGAGIALDAGPIRSILMSLPLFIMFGYALKWFVWDSAKKSYQEYKKEKSTLFDTIKTSDQK